MANVIELQMDYKYLYEVACKEKQACMAQYLELAETAANKVFELQQENARLKKSLADYEKQLFIF